MYVDYKLPVKLTEDKRAQMEKRNAELDLNLMAQDAILKEARDAHKAATTLDKDEKKRNLSVLRDGYELLMVKAMEYVNEDEGTIQYLDEEGIIVHERALSLEERRQYRIQFGRRQIAD